MRWRLLFFTAIFALCPQCMFAAAPANSPAPDFTRAILELADPNVAVRESASNTLWSAGNAAEPALRQAVQSGDPEITARAREILADFRYGILPDLPADVVALMRTYRRGSASEKQTTIAALLRLDRRAFPALLRLASAEPDANLRRSILGTLSTRALAAAPALIAEGSLDNAERMLEIAISSGSDQALRSYAAFLLLSGRLDAKLASLLPHADESASDARTLVYLLRAKGDLLGARAMAEKANDPDLADLLQNTLFEALDAKSLVFRLQQTAQDGADLEKLAILAACQRLAGRDADFTRTLEGIRRFADGPPQGAIPAAEALLVNGQAEEAISILVNHGAIQQAFDLLIARRDYKQAFALAEKPADPARVDAVRLRCSVARAWHTLGEKDKALTILDQLAALPELEIGFQGRCALISAESSCGMSDRAFEHAVQTISGPGSTGDLVSLFRALFPSHQSDAVSWWNFFRISHSSEPAAQTLRRLRPLFERTLPEASLRPLVTEAIQFSRGMSLRDRPAFLQVVARTVFDMGAEQTGQILLKTAANLGGDIELGNLAAARQQWDLAEQFYFAASRMVRDDPVTIALHGQGLVHTGRSKEGQATIQRGNLLALADSSRRLQLARALRKAGLREESLRQYELLSRLADFSSVELVEALYTLAAASAHNGDYAAAAAAHDRIILVLLSSETAFLLDSAQLTIPYLARKYAAASAIQNRQFDQARRHIEAAAAILPAESGLAIDLYPLYQRANLQADADAILARCIAPLQKIAADHPNAAETHNEIAWTLARCRCRLDEALAHARKAAELEPKNPAILDTLAEVYFQQGQKQQAIDTINQCVQLEPRVARHKLALKRFGESTPQTDPPPETPD